MKEETLIKTIDTLLLTASALLLTAFSYLPIVEPTREKALKERRCTMPLLEEPVKAAKIPNKAFLGIANLQTAWMNCPITYETIELEYITRGLITAYCNCSKCCTYAGQRTASGVFPHYSDNNTEPTTCAIDPRYYRWGTLFLIDGKLYVAEDSGSAVLGASHFDLYFDSHYEVSTFGTHYSNVYKVSYKTHGAKGVEYVPNIINRIVDSKFLGWSSYRDGSRIGSR